MIFKNIPILLVAALAPASLFATDVLVAPDQPFYLSELADGQSDASNLNILVQNPSETLESTIEWSGSSTNALNIQTTSLSLNQGALNIINKNYASLEFIGITFNIGSESSQTTVKTAGVIQFSKITGSLVNTNLHIQSASTVLTENNRAYSPHFSTITVNNNASLILSDNGVYSVANLLIDRRLLVSSRAILKGNNSSQAGFISDSTLSNLNIENAAITHRSHLTLDNVLLTNSTLTANNLSLVQRDVDASQTLTITTEATITGDLTLDVYLADIASLGVEFSFSADGITGLTDSNLAINFYDSLTNELYATGTDFTLNSGVYTSSVKLIPEPSTASLSLLALAGLIARRRRKSELG